MIYPANIEQKIDFVVIRDELLTKLKIGPKSNLLRYMNSDFRVGIYPVVIAFANKARLLNLGVLVNSRTKSTTELSYLVSGSGRMLSVQ